LRAICALVAGCLFASSVRADTAETNPFVVRPYIQLGNNPTCGAKVDTLALMWISKDSSESWSVRIKPDGQNAWTKSIGISRHDIKRYDDGFDYVYECQLKNIPMNKAFEYQVLKNENPVFKSFAHARKTKEQPYKFDVFGDMGADTLGQRRIGNLSYQAEPDFIVFPGDLVYSSGLYRQYLTNFFPIYNADKSDSNLGVPLLRSVLTIGLVGNHDVSPAGMMVPADFDAASDALAYFYLWSEPLNGPPQLKQSAKESSENPKSIPTLTGSASRIEAFKKAAGEHFPGMCNFSFDYANSHWLVLDGNYYTDWSDPALQKWVADDLQKAQKATWRFVTFHQPGFSMDAVHAAEQRMRMLSDIFQKGNVDIVFSGHAHDYQRTFPITFKPKLRNNKSFMNGDGTVDGTITLDKTFDGSKITKPKGIIYIITGAGGAQLYPAMSGSDAVKLDFIDKFNSGQYSLTSCEVNDRKFEMKQIADDGRVIDRFTIIK
jgi:3',5'-cyclic AMP phosphodiesterase CpdA